MSKFGTVHFRGQSGTRYLFSVYPLETAIRDGYSGVYVITERKAGKAKGSFVHKRICTGEGENLSLMLPLDHFASEGKGVKCICVHAEKDAAMRQQIEQDLASPAAGRAG